MKVRKYVAQNMQEGLLRVKEDLGPEAVIIHSRKIRPKGIRGFFLPPRLEITAALESYPGINGIKEKLLLAEVEKQLRDGISEIKAHIDCLASRGEFPCEYREEESEGFKNWQKKLEQQDLYPGLIQDLLEGIRNGFAGEVQLSEEIIGVLLDKKMRKALKTAPEKSEAVQVFVGPTGVGKTTTLAKLAARYALYQGERAGIITIDHYRIGAVEQLRTYAEITGLPLHVAMSPAELDTALHKLQGCRRILIDTAGRSTLNAIHIKELAAYLSRLPAAEIFLVISATTKSGDLRLIIDGFKGLGCNRLIFSKLDETDSFGVLLNGIHGAGLPVTYLTTGQNVPEDISLADADKMSALILGEER